MPFIYSPLHLPKKYSVSVIFHYAFEDTPIPDDIHRISMLTDDYQQVINEMIQSDYVISESLHGLILAESYGVPVVAYIPPNIKTFKYDDYFEGTGRYGIRYAKTLQEALEMQPLPLPELTKCRERLMAAFPYDLWD